MSKWERNPGYNPRMFRATLRWPTLFREALPWRRLVAKGGGRSAMFNTYQYGTDEDVAKSVLEDEFGNAG